MLVTFTIEKYGDEVLLDVVHMHTGNLLLGRSWQYNRKVTMMGLGIYIDLSKIGEL